MLPTAPCRRSIRTFRRNNMRGYAIRLAGTVLVIMATAGSSAFAQNTNTGRFVTGPLTWTPGLQLREAGVDSNVFNTPTDPKEDVSAGAMGQITSVLNLGILQAATNGSAEYVYFEKYAQERGVNRRVSTHLEFPVTRFSPDVTFAWGHAKERSSNEVDTRAPRTDLEYTFGIQTRLTSRIALTASGGKQKATYAPGFTFRDVEIAKQLNRETLLANITSRVTLTPFTVLAVDATVGRDEFPLRPDAATDNVRLTGGFEFAPDAVVRGRASIGYHSMQPHRRGVPNALAADFAGMMSTIDLGYTLLDVTRFNGNFSHDSTYSISTTQPFYVSTLGGLQILQALFGPVDLD